MALLADGLRADDIADHLGISTSTVYRHIERAKTRTRVASRSELIAVAIRNGVVPLTTAAATATPTMASAMLRRAGGATPPVGLAP